MFFKKVEVEEFKGYKKTKLQKLLDEFVESGFAMVELQDWENNYAGSSSVQAAFATAIKRFHYDNIECKTINKKVYLINKIVFEKETE